MFTCRKCNGSDFTVDQMKKEPFLFSNNRGICKPCISKYETHEQFIRKANKNPENYLTCEDCDRMFSKNLQGRFKKLRTECPFCKSENIERY